MKKNNKILFYVFVVLILLIFCMKKMDLNYTFEKKIEDVMFYLKPKYIKKVPSDKRVIYKARNYEDYEAIVNACNEYRVINKIKNRHGIGYISAHSHFDKLLNDPELTSVLHLPLK